MTKLYINFDKITDCLKQAADDGRSFLYEYEAYTVLKNLGSETPPQVNLISRGYKPSNEELESIPGSKVVLKIVSPTIFHKTDVGGVKIIDKIPNKIRAGCRKMMDEVPVKYALWIEKNRDMAPENYRRLSGEKLTKAISDDIKGVLLCEFMPPDSEAFGNELLVSIRRTREFGMVITAGLGGTDTELYARRFKKGQAVVSASTAMTDGETFFRLFKNTISYRKLAGISRSQERIVSNDQLLECFAAFIQVANFYSPDNPDAPFVIDELEVNPFAFTEYLMVPLDGICRFSVPEKLPLFRPVHKIDNLLHPKTIAIIGVSATSQNFGRIILGNILDGGFKKEQITIIRPEADSIDGVTCVSSVMDMKTKADLFIVAVAAGKVPDLIDQIIDADAAGSVMLIPGGLGEKEGSQERAAQIQEKINTAHATDGGGPVFLGGNCMGIVSNPGNCDTFFIPKEKLPDPKTGFNQASALVSQSGAFIITRLSNQPLINPAYMVSMGNQIDITVSDLIHYMKNLKDLDVIAIYMEGFNDLDGLELCRAIQSAVQNGKHLIFYKAGRTPEGKSATSGHTASIAGDYMVCESCISQAGAMVADNFPQFEALYKLAITLKGKKINGNRLGAMSAAGFEAVGMADSIQGDTYEMKMANLDHTTIAKLDNLLSSSRLDAIVDIKNPLDITPGADDALHADAVDILIADPNVDGLVVGIVPLSPSMQTLPPGRRKAESFESPQSIASLLSARISTLDKPVLSVVDGGRLYDGLADELEKKGLPVFRSSDMAVSAFAKYVNYRLHLDTIREAVDDN